MKARIFLSVFSQLNLALRHFPTRSNLLAMMFFYFLCLCFILSASSSTENDPSDSTVLLSSNSMLVKTLFHRQLSLVSSSSVTNLTGKSTRHNCSAACSGRYTFDGPIERPVNCSRRIASFQCVVQVDIIYEFRLILVSFLTTGTEFNSDSITMFAAHQVAHTYASNFTTITMMSACFTTDDCDWDYVKVFITKYITETLPSFFATYRPLFLNSAAGAVSQCFSQNNPIACTNGRCSSTVIETNAAYVNRSCLLNSPDVRIDIIRLRVYPTPNSLGQTYFIATCNRNLCNNGTLESMLKDAIAANASSFELPVLSRTTSLYLSPLSFWKIGIWFFFVLERF